MNHTCRQNYPSDIENAVNKQIQLELQAFYYYLSAATYFDKEDVALPGCFKFFTNSSKEELDHAQQFINYQNIRGGTVDFKPLDKCPEWNSPMEVFTRALEMELQVNESILQMYKLADELGDLQTTGFLDPFLEEQVKSQKELSNIITMLKRVGPSGVTLYIFDNQLSLTC